MFILMAYSNDKYKTGVFIAMFTPEDLKVAQCHLWGNLGVWCYIAKNHGINRLTSWDSSINSQINLLL